MGRPNLRRGVYAALVGLIPFFVFGCAPLGLGAPITITEGGTYSGEWRNLDPDVPAVRIDTEEPVVIEDAVIRSRGDLIVAEDDADVTVRNSRGYGLNPGVAGKAPGRFFASGRFAGVVVENNYLKGTSGIYLHDDRASSLSGRRVKIVRNRVKNIDGRHSDGARGYSKTGYDVVQFVQLNGVRGLQSAEIAWNQVMNFSGESRVEDNISIYLSSGTPDHPIRIHDNYIQGAYPTNPSEDSYSGGGIMVGDGSAGSDSEVPHHVEAYNNQLIDTTNYGVAIAAGHDSSYHHNRVISDGLLDDGTRAAAQNVGIYVWNSSNSPYFYSNSAYSNQVGWLNSSGSRNDWWLPQCSGDCANSQIPGPVDASLEAAEYERWLRKLSAAKVAVGPQGRGGSPRPVG